MHDTDEELRVKLNAETGTLTWPELEKHFARGVVINVAPELDLVEVALCVVKDDRAAIEGWMREGKLAQASVENAENWHQQGATLWAVVTAPWVLVQEPRD